MIYAFGVYQGKFMAAKYIVTALCYAVQLLKYMTLVSNSHLPLPLPHYLYCSKKDNSSIGINNVLSLALHQKL